LRSFRTNLEGTGNLLTQVKDRVMNLEKYSKKI